MVIIRPYYVVVGKTLSTLGAKVLGYGRSLKPALEASHLAGYFAGEKLPELLQECDYVVNVLPHTDETIGLLNGNVLENCKGTLCLHYSIFRIITLSLSKSALTLHWAGAIT